MSAGEAYYLEPDHNVVCDEGALAESSPRDRYRETTAALTEKMQAIR